MICVCYAVDQTYRDHNPYFGHHTIVNLQLHLPHLIEFSPTFPTILIEFNKTFNIPDGI